MDDDEWEDMAAELSKDFEALLAAVDRRPPREILPLGQFLRRVADRAGIDIDDARRGTGAVLETLGERITHGEVEDLATELDPELRPALERGDEQSRGKAERMDLDEFVSRVADREGVEHEQAEDHVRAVLQTLREAITERELSDLTAQLPREYAAVIGGR